MPTVVPLIWTIAPGIGAFVARFVTLPVSVTRWGGVGAAVPCASDFDALSASRTRMMIVSSLMEKSSPVPWSASRRISSTGAFCRCSVIPLTARIELLL